MEKKIGAYEVRRQLGRVLREVAGEGNQYVVERNGEPVAAVVPIEIYAQWKKARQELSDIMREAAARSDVASEEEAEAIVAEAIRAVREEETRQAG
ncbi:MAG: type II toxin-antitoxin system Phd/YefM family antitoxin [Chloroflexi bacterium]|nr:type II toxin-antitoxin system Phd/YefM family antitoxin [Chloroflexota bacterium]